MVAHVARQNLSKVTDMYAMFNATSFNQPLNNWNVSNVTDMWCMFRHATSFNQPLNNWNVSNDVTETEGILPRLARRRVRVHNY